jgi:RHS repeat-associated protein
LIAIHSIVNVSCLHTVDKLVTCYPQASPFISLNHPLKRLSLFRPHKENMNLKKLWLSFAVILMASASLIAQTNPNEEQGLKPYDSWHGGDLDSISMTSGGLVLHIPLASFPQRGNLDLSFMVRHSSKQWHFYMPPSGRNPSWQPLPNTGTQIVSSVDWWMQATLALDAPGYDWTRSATSPDGNSHFLGGQDGTGGPVYPLRSRDATGLLHPNTNTLILPNGTHLNYSMDDSTTTGRTAPPTPFLEGVQPTTITDANGNQITISASGWTDTLGRLIPGYSPSSGMPVQPGVPTSDLSACPAGTVSALVWNLPPPAGISSRKFTFCYSNIAIQTQFNRGGTAEYSGTWTLLTTIVEPDSTQWTFAYDSYGDVTRLGFPTGGSISYTYQIGPQNCGSGTDRSLWVATRTVDANDGTGPHTWNYNFVAAPGSIYPASGTATVTSPDGNDTVHTINAPVSGACAGYDVQVKNYEGPTSGNNVLKTVQTQYTGTAISDGSVIAGNVVPTQVIVTVPGGLTSKVINSYDLPTTDVLGDPIIIGSLLQRDEYDFSNTLTRSTVHRYLWQDNPPYLPINFVSLKSSVTVKDGAGNQVAQTTYGYDDVSRIFSFGNSVGQVAAPAGSARGNLNYVSRWLNTTNSMVTMTANVYDTGEPYQTIDPLGNITTFSYSPNFYGAYVTQTNLPDTQMPDSGAPVVHHIISGNYDFNTGLLLTFTDENSQNYSYTYDVMLRLTQGNHPDGGITKFLYPDPNTVERQRLITGTTYDDFKVKFDGVGRPYQTIQTTPDCSGGIKVDTAYDVVGRVKTVSNPYCLTSEPTFGITQTAYDPLSRTISTTKQDGSVTSVKYEDTPGDTSGAPLVCTTATDESGKKRQACSDTFGRLAKVIEPNPGAAATNATGWVTVSGTEQLANSQPATSGQATITISGTEQKVCGNPSRCSPTSGPFIYDTGTVTLTVSGFSAKTVSYGQGDTPAIVAWKLSCAFHNDGASAADASCPTSAGSSTQVVLTARATGTASNYSFTTSSATSDGSVNFLHASFTAAPASGTFTGGQNASSTPDAGNVTITINGTPYSTTFGAGDTYTTIASRLATAISAGSYASATASGGTLNLTSKTAGTLGDYSLSDSYTWNSAQFTNPSFTTSTSGPALSGAKDASALNNNPFVTTYQYNARGDMLCVHQKATDTTADVPCTGTSAPSVPASWRQRFFTYDSLSRLLTASNPEISSQSGQVAITYQYDNDGNVLSKTGPAPNQSFTASPVQMLIITYAYDALNRLLDTTFSDGTTLKASHRYDYATFQGQSFTNPKGREVAAFTVDGNNTNVSSVYTSYDPMGRVLSTTQCHPGVTGCKIFSAGDGGTIQGYDKVGDLLNLIYPGNGFMVTYGYDSAARLTTATDSNGVTYANASAPNSYSPFGALREFISQNFANNKYHVDYNNRLQPIEIWAGSAQGSPALFDKQYFYGTAGANNGNIFTITNAKDSTRTQSFAYDPLNRLLTGGDNGHWANTYTYDPWGNLTNKTPGSPAGENMNQPADTNNHLSGLTYDAAGNVTNDRLGGAFVFDGENRIKSAGSVTYTYDADGRHIQKSSGTNYWYGPGGQVFAETDPAGNWTNYIIFGGQRLARNVSGDIKYYITDHLHSTAMFVDKAGTTAAILDDNDMYPWGGVVPGVGKTTSNNTVKFTGQYRDTDTAANLDYFGARYYSNTIGRFMSPDWAGAPTAVPYAKFGDPQSLNLYSYTENGPINRIDADGHGFVNEAFQDWDFDIRQVGYAMQDASQSNGDSQPTPQTGGHAPEWFQKLYNKFKYKHFVTDKELNAALKDDAKKAKDTMRSRGVTAVVRGKEISSDAYFKGKSNREVVDAYNAYEEQRNKGLVQDALAVITTLQSGNSNTINKNTAKALNEHFGESLEPREWGRALESLKQNEGLPNDFHGKILSNGNFANPDTGAIIGNIGDYLP